MKNWNTFLYICIDIQPHLTFFLTWSKAESNRISMIGWMMTPLDIFLQIIIIVYFLKIQELANFVKPVILVQKPTFLNKVTQFALLSFHKSLSVNFAIFSNSRSAIKNANAFRFLFCLKTDCVIPSWWLYLLFPCVLRADICSLFPHIHRFVCFWGNTSHKLAINSCLGS